MTKFIKVIAAVALAAIGQTLFAYNGGYENSLTTDTVIGGKTYKGYGNNTLTARTESGTTIGANAYAQCSKLTSVSLANVTSIGNAAFAYSALTSVELPATLKSMGYIAFGGCKNLSSITINSTAFMTSADEAKEPFRDCTALKTVTAKCAPPSWDFKKVFPTVTTVKVPQANLSAWQAKKYSGVTVAKFEENVYTISFHQNASPYKVKDLTYAVGAAKTLPYISSGLGWEVPAGKSFLGWDATKGSTVAHYANAEKVTDLAKAGETAHLYAIWRPVDSYVIRYHRNTSASDTATVLHCGNLGAKVTLPYLGSGLGWTVPSGYTFLGWAKSATATTATYKNAEKVDALGVKGSTVELYAIWKKASAAVATPEAAAVDVASAVPVSATPAVNLEPPFVPGYYHGVLADGSGLFDLILDEDATAFFRAETEDGDWAAECEAEVVGDVLVLTFENDRIVLRRENGLVVAE